MLAVPVGAGAAPPITDTQVEKFSETFSDEPFLCQEELYEQTATGQIVTHITAAGLDEDGNPILPLHFHFLIHAQVVAVPLAPRAHENDRAGADRWTGRRAVA